MAQGQSQSAVRERQSTELREPRQYKVEIHNDDFTTMDFVVKILKELFLKSDAEAEHIMMTTHKAGKALVGIYSYDIARTKVGKAMAMARDEGFPLRLTYEPE